MNSKDVLVLGAGVSGFSTGILLLKAGYKVTIWAKDLPPNTTSNMAAAVWYPYLCNPKEKALPWAKATYEYFSKELVGKEDTGCVYKTMTDMSHEPLSDPWWKDAIPTGVEHVKTDLPNGYVDAYKIKTIVIDTSLYMNYLLNVFKNLGGYVIQKEVKNIEEAFKEYSIVVNCTGLGSKELFNDNELYPVRGQMIKIKANGYEDVTFGDFGPNDWSLIAPRVNDIMLGGTAQKDDWNTKIDPKDTEDILRKVKIVAPNLGNIEVVSEQVGLRPARSGVRLEMEKIGQGKVIHNYGHGGSGFTLSWGCAADVVKIAEGLS